MNQSFLILGREPSLSFCELYQYLGQDSQKISSSAEGAVLIDDADLGQRAPYVLAGIVKSGVIIKSVSKLEAQDLVDIFKTYLKEDTKFNFGLSLYRLSASSQTLTLPFPWKGEGAKKLGLEVKKLLKALGASVRLVESKSNNLSAVDVVKNRLLKDGMELCIFTTSSGFLIGITQAVQPFAEYSHRDYDRPGRDAKSGMLPPKLAKAMVNIAVPVGTRHALSLQILDPFCGSGTVLQEAMLLGHNVIVTDIETQAIIESKKNIEWLIGEYHELKTLS
ncbi:MAG: DNA methyltransferase, partial [Candidatus Komeilibacteria bacterium]|nr:DNA methyltransferase [Candidatus Komeilibacteria bacterium]